MNGTDTNTPKVSVIMNCRNSAAYLKDAIDSVYAQTFKDWEIVFWDNCSMDDSAGIAKSYDYKLKYFKGDVVVPLGRARNLAIAEARGEYIAFLDCDDIWLPLKLEEQIKLFEANSAVGLVYCDTIFFKDGRDLYSVFGRERPHRGMVFDKLLARYFLSMETVVIRRQALDGLDHWFDDELVMAEEMDLFLRIAYRWELNFVDRPLAKWRMHDASESSKRGYLVPKEKEIIIDKLIRMCPDIEIKYSAEIKEQRKMIAYEWALSAWKDGDKRRMRRCLKPQLFSDGKSAIAYALSMLPYATYKRIKDSYHSLKFDSYRISKK